jgi:hypothetical protein
MPSIGLAPGARIVQPLRRRPRLRAPAGRRCKMAMGKVRNFRQPLPAAQWPGDSIAGGQIYLSQGTTVAMVARARTPEPALLIN